MLFQQARELQTRELTPLVGVEDLRCAIAGQGLLDRLAAKVRGQRIGEPPRQHPATRPVQDGEQLHEAARHRDVGDIGRPDMVRAGDLRVAQEIGIHCVGRMPLASAGLAIHGLNAHAPHQGGHVPPPTHIASVPQEIAQHSGAGKRILQMPCVDLAHQHQIRGRHRRGLVVGRRARQPEDLTLSNDGQGMGSGDHRFALSHPALLSAPSKQSCSSASCPIFAWRTLRSGMSAVGLVPPNTSAARASNCCFHSVIWVGWT